MEAMKNIVLIGMPATGKSVVGKALAEKLGYTFVDVDDLIVAEAGKPLSAILYESGPDALLELENRVGRSMKTEKTVISTGGSMVLSEEAMEHLRHDAVVIWLQTPLAQLCERLPDDLWERGIIAPRDWTVEQIYEQRQPLYIHYADLIVAGVDGQEDMAHRVEQILRMVGMELR